MKRRKILIAETEEMVGDSLKAVINNISLSQAQFYTQYLKTKN